MDSGSETDENETKFDTSHRPKYSLSSFDRKRKPRVANNGYAANETKSRYEQLCDRFGGDSDTNSSQKSDESVSSEERYRRSLKSKGSQTPTATKERKTEPSESESSGENRRDEDSQSDKSDSFNRSPSFSEIALVSKAKSKRNRHSSPVNDIKKPQKVTKAEKLFDQIKTGPTSPATNDSYTGSSYFENSFTLSDRSTFYGAKNSSVKHELSETEDDNRSEASTVVDKSESENEQKRRPSKGRGKRKKTGRKVQQKKAKIDKQEVQQSDTRRRSSRRKSVDEKSVENDIDSETDAESDSRNTDVKPKREAINRKPCPASKKSSTTKSGGRETRSKKTSKPSSETTKAIEVETDTETEADIKRSATTSSGRSSRAKPCPASKKAKGEVDTDASDAEYEEDIKKSVTTSNRRSSRAKPCPASKKAKVEVDTDASDAESEEDVKKSVTSSNKRASRAKPCPASKKAKITTVSSEEEQEVEKKRLRTTRRSNNLKPTPASKKVLPEIVISDSEDEHISTRPTRHSKLTKSGALSKKSKSSDLSPLTLSKRSFHLDKENSKVDRTLRNKSNLHYESNENISSQRSKPCPASKKKQVQKPIWETYKNVDYPSFTVEGRHRKFLRGDYVRVSDSDACHLNNIGSELVLTYNWPVKRLYHFFNDLNRNLSDEVKYYDEFFEDEKKKCEKMKAVNKAVSPMSPRRGRPQKKITFTSKDSTPRKLTFSARFKTKAELKDMTVTGLRPVASRLARAAHKRSNRFQRGNSSNKLRVSKILKKSKAIVKKSKYRISRRRKKRVKFEDDSSGESDVDVYFHETDIFTSINLNGAQKTEALLSACKECHVLVERMDNDVFETYLKKRDRKREEDVSDLLDHMLNIIQERFDDEFHNESDNENYSPRRKPGPRRRQKRYSK